MKKILFVLMLVLFISCGDTTTEPIDKTATKVTVDEIKTQVSFAAFQSTYDAYTPSPEYVDSLKTVYKSESDKFYFYLKMDCECNASAKLLPRMIKTLDEAGISHDNVNMYMMLDETYSYPEKDFITVTDLPQLFVKHGSTVLDMTSTPDSISVESLLYESFK